MTIEKKDYAARLSALTAEQRALLELRLKNRGLRAPEGLGIPRRSDVGDAPLSIDQERLWFIDRLAPGMCAYGTHLGMVLSGALDVPALERSIDAIVDRHESLRTIFPEVSGRPIQVVQDRLKVGCAIEDLRRVARPERQARLQARLAELADQPFDLARGPLIRATLLRTDELEHVLLVSIHHIATDHVSFNVFQLEMAALYSAFSRGERALLPESSIRYVDYAAWQRDYLQGAVLERLSSYWKRQLEGASFVLDMPTDLTRPPFQSFNGRRRNFTLPGELARDLKAIGVSEHATSFMVYMAAFGLLLHRYSRQTEVVVGTPIANRHRSETEHLIGYLLTMLAIRTSFAGRPSFRELLSRVKRTLLGAYAHQDMPFGKLVEVLNPDRDVARNPVFQTSLIYLESNGSSPDFSGLEVRPLLVDHGGSRLDLSLVIWESPRGLTGFFEYSTDLWNPSTVDRMITHFGNLLRSIAADPDRDVAAFSWMAEGERHQLLVEWNATSVEHARDTSLHQRFEEQVERTPERVALVAGEEQLSYRELNTRANRVARYLKGMGVRPEQRIAICLERSVELVVGILGILKAGGAYVPLDPAYPEERLTFMLEDAQASVVVTRGTWGERLGSAAVRVVDLDADGGGIDAHRGTNLRREAVGGNLAYLIYTSGSTGRPKAAAIEHRSAVALVSWAGTHFAADHLAGVLASTSVCFDLSIFELFVPLLTGNTVILIDGLLSLPRLRTAPRITLVNTVPSMMQELLHSGELPGSVRTVNLAGEALGKDLVERIYEHASVREVVNLYGPSETTTYSTFSAVPRGGKEAPCLGRPLGNTRVYLLDEGQCPVPMGAVGEAFLGGEGLARGYWNRPDLTAERFVPNPFGEEEGARLYRTGDRVRHRSDGSLDFLGRADQQVKVRGVRIELGEVEAALRRHVGVREAVVVSREDGLGSKSLAAYVTTREESRFSLSDLRRFLANQLPSAMVPSAIVFLEALPSMPNGKVDRQALRSPEGVRDPGCSPPRTPVEEILAGIWSEVLRTERVGVEDDFFQCGGHSLLAMQVISRVREAFAVEVPVRALFEAPTLAELAERIERSIRAGAGASGLALRRGSPGGRLPLSFAQERLWFLDRLEPGNPAYNLLVLARIADELDVAALERSLRELTRRHEGLRSRFVSVDGRPVQLVDPVSLSVRIVDLQEVAQREELGQKLAREERLRGFDLERGPLLRVLVLRLGANEHLLLITLHHIVADHWSLEVMMSELGSLYRAHREGRPAPFPELPIQYADFARAQREWLQGEVLERQLGYWREQLTGAASLQLPTDHPRARLQAVRAGRADWRVSHAVTTALKTLGRRQGATLFMTLLAAFEVLLLRHTGQEDICVGTPIGNRPTVDTEGLIGLFLNTLVLRTNHSGDPSFRDLLARVREQALAAYAHQDLPFEKLLEELRPARDLSRTPLFQVFFNMVNLPELPFWIPGLTLEALGGDDSVAKFDLTVYAQERDGELRGHLVFNRDLFDGERMREMARQYEGLLRQVAERPEERISRFSLVTPAAREIVPDAGARLDETWHGAIHDLFTAQARRAPTRVAVVDSEESWSYADLEGDSTRLAHRLVEGGLRPGDVVAIYADRSAALVPALLGVLKSGGAFLILDSAHPASRLAELARTARPRGWIVLESAGPLPEGLRSCCEAVRRDCIVRLPRRRVVSDGSNGAWMGGECPLVELGAEDVACVTFTSGSTGRPKGVLGRHGALSHSLPWMIEKFGFKEEDRFSLLLSLSHDPLHREIFTPLALGAAVCVPEEDVIASGRLAEWMERVGITAAHLTPSLARMMSAVSGERALPSLRLVFSLGDALTWRDAADLRRMAPNARVVSLYGATETQRAGGYWVAPNDAGERQAEAGQELVPLGLGIEDTQLLVLNSAAEGAGIGELGEVWIRSPHLAAGYLGDAPLTEERFKTNPVTGVPGDRVYRTGDWGSYLPDGNVRFAGRRDNQIKVRGFRVDPSEIEAVLASEENVREAAAVAVGEAGGERRLVAYVIATSPVSTLRLRRFLKDRLPSYLVPAEIVLVESLPRTGTGKIDRAALPGIMRTPSFAAEAPVAPRSATERLIAEIWREELRIDAIGVHDNFFDLGGHSLQSMVVMDRLEKRLNLRIRPRDIFLQTLGQLARTLDVTRGIGGESPPN